MIYKSPEIKYFLIFNLILGFGAGIRGRILTLIDNKKPKQKNHSTIYSLAGTGVLTRDLLLKFLNQSACFGPRV